MKIRFWGVRGSVPTPGNKTAKFGGNTSCVELITETGESLIFDAGTGIRELGLDYLKRDKPSKEINIFISHVHWDHIQGFPYFVPAYFPDIKINIYSGIEIKKEFSAQMEPPYFPLRIGDLKSKIEFHKIKKTGGMVGSALIKPILLVHPQEVYGFVISDGSKTAVYSTDTEHKTGGDHEKFIDTIRGADVMMFDAQYTPEEYSTGRIGWGHSTFEAAADIAKKANIKKLILFHHEPTHDDATIAAIEKEAKKLFPNTIAAREGASIEV
jgi:phosphoribosyl 1,2-cyclic phosphodiesterase